MDSATLHSRLVFPNPFRPVGVEFDLAEEALVSLDIVDASGVLVESVVRSSPLGPGHHVVGMPTQRAAGGAFAYRLTVQYSASRVVETRSLRGLSPSE
jgi:hypothetical protein